MDQQECQHQQLPDQQQPQQHNQPPQQHHQPSQQHFLDMQLFYLKQYYDNMTEMLDDDLLMNMKFFKDMLQTLDRQRFQDRQRFHDMQQSLGMQLLQLMQYVQHNRGSVPVHGTARPVMTSVGTSTSDSCTSQGENSLIPDHQEDEAVNESRYVRILRQDVLKIRDAILKHNSTVKGLREENAKLKHLLSIKFQEEDMKPYLQEIQQLVQNNLENPPLDSSQDSDMT